ncbi:hypothetical protein, partial [Nocardia brasiliensis]|uniref:hypothetical protein n=1 Tax=Nocardia brasiliensis TaxID=37326 RepID=UPI002455805F
HPRPTHPAVRGEDDTPAHRGVEREARDPPRGAPPGPPPPHPAAAGGKPPGAPAPGGPAGRRTAHPAPAATP